MILSSPKMVMQESGMISSSLNVSANYLEYAWHGAPTLFE